MDVQVDITFDQLVDAIRKLPPEQREKLKTIIDLESKKIKSREELIASLLNGPVATEEELRTIENNRKAINQWGKTG
jgi:hypothetical protein